jgi:hypothetical protein
MGWFARDLVSVVLALPVALLWISDHSPNPCPALWNPDSPKFGRRTGMAGRLTTAPTPEQCARVRRPHGWYRDDLGHIGQDFGGLEAVRSAMAFHIRS